MRIAGNADIDVVDALNDGTEHGSADESDFKRSSARWAADRLNPDELRYLESMPFSHRLSPTTNAADDLVVTHANPTDRHTLIAPPEHEQLERLGKVALRHDPEQIDELLAGVDAGAVTADSIDKPHTNADSPWVPRRLSTFE